MFNCYDGKFLPKYCDCNMKNIIISLIGIMLFCSCSKDQAYSLQLNENSKEETTIKPQEAISALESMLHIVDTKSMENLSTTDLFVIGKNDLFAETKSFSAPNIPDTLLYALNFEHGGFALMAANTRINSSVLCVTESGNIGYENIHNAMKFLSDTNDASSTSSIKSNENVEDEDFVDAGQVYVYSLLLSSAILDYFDDNLLGEGIPLTKDTGGAKYGPYLTTKWTQGGPFDDLTPNNYPAGCVVIAVAQIMAYNNKPASSEFITTDRPWSLLKTVYPYDNRTSMGSADAQKAVAYMAQVLGYKKNCDVNYAADGSSSNTDKAKRTFQNYGYNNVTKRLGCESGDIKKINSQIASGRPVYMAGMRKGSGHAWVIDGMDGNYYHINWGWQGDCDGYYAKGTFNTSSMGWHDSVYDPGTSNMSGRNYYHYFRLLLYTL